MRPAALILIVEDEAQIRMLLVSVVERYGYRVVLANERVTAVEILRAKRPDLVIADVRLRGGNGNDLAKLADTMNIPVLLTSAEPLAIEQYAGRTTPAFLLKPFRPSELENKIEELLRKSSKG